MAPARWVALVGGVLAIGVVSWPLPVAPADQLAGSPFGEVDNHFWFLWLAIRRAAGEPGPWTNVPDGWDLPMMDPVNLPWAMLAWPLGPVLAYRAVLFVNLALAAVGGWWLGREASESDEGAVVGMAAMVGAPFLAGIVDFGITESWTAGWLALAAAGALRFARRGTAGALVASGLGLAGFLWSGWYAAVFAVPAWAGIVGWAGSRSGWARRVVAGLVLAGAVAGASRVPALLEYLADQGRWSARFSGLSAARDVADWRANPYFGVDLLCFFLPQPDALPVSRTVYLGLPIVVLALWSGRRGRWALGTAAALLMLATGHWLRVGGKIGPVPLRMPAGLLVEWFPAFEGLSHWYRATGPAVVFLAAAAAMGAAPLVRRLRRPWVGAAVLGAGIVAEGVWSAPTAWPRRAYAVDPPAELAELPGEGALLQLPIDDVGSPPPARSRRPYNQWQPFHGRPVAENYEGPDAAFGVTPVVPILNGLCGAPVPPGTPETLPADLTPALAALDRAGFAWIVVHPRLARTPGPCVEALRGAMGEPEVETGEVVGWRVR